METLSPNSPQREKLYVLAQCAGWGGFTLAYFGLNQLARSTSVAETSIFIASNLVGLLLSHGYRSWIHRRGWKDLGWTALLPRVLVGTLVLGILWTLLTWPLYLYFGDPHIGKKVTKTVIFIFSVFNGIWIYGFWSLLYFGYHMASRFRRSELERVQLKATVKEAELRALKSQVNPHFIFNALNSMRALIDEDPARARQAVTQLANLLRYSLQSGQLETVPFEDELRIVKDYLALEQVRHEERLKLHLDIDPDTLHLPIPPMLLQTLVENGVKYGISERPDGGEIVITARRSGDGMNLQVTNSGELHAAADRPTPSEIGSTGVGLQNAAQRLRLLFGEKATLSLSQGAPGVVVAEANIPRLLTRTPVPVDES